MDDLRARIEAYLAAHNVMTLATHGPDGPWAAAVFYANEGLTFYFVSAPGRRHCTDIEETGQVAAAIHKDYSDWPEIKGVQMEGVATRLSGAEQQAAIAVYARKFPAYADPATAAPQIAAALKHGAWYRVSPRLVRLIDNSKGFGHKEELRVEGDTAPRSMFAR